MLEPVAGGGFQAMPNRMAEVQAGALAAFVRISIHHTDLDRRRTDNGGLQGQAARCQAFE